MSINGKSGLTRQLTVTDAAETNVVASHTCGAIYVVESRKASGHPRIFLVRGPMPGSAQIPQPEGTQFCFPGPFGPGDIAGTIELDSNGGDTSTFNVAELSQ